MEGKKQSKTMSTMHQEAANAATNLQAEDCKSDECLSSAERMKATADIPHMDLTDDTCSVIAKYFTRDPSSSSSAAAFNAVSSITLPESTTTTTMPAGKKYI